VQSEVRAVVPAELALRLDSSSGATAFAIYIVGEQEVVAVTSELGDELAAMGTDTKSISAASGARLLRELDGLVGIAIIDATGFQASDWSLLDRRRSRLARAGASVLVTTQASFDSLMAVAPNLASWIGGETFMHPQNEYRDSELGLAREERLAALRAWHGLSDKEVLELARDNRLPSDPDFAEWLVLLGHADMIHA
jgi:hypothetical protein